MKPLKRNEPLPEVKFTYRRIFSYVIVAICLFLIYKIVGELQGSDRLADVAKWLIYLCALVITYYMVAPSAEQIVKAIQAAKLYRQVPELFDDYMERSRGGGYGSGYGGGYGYNDMGGGSNFPDPPFGGM